MNTNNLIPCLDCEARISRFADVCPHCGCNYDNLLLFQCPQCIAKVRADKLHCLLCEWDWSNCTPMQLNEIVEGIPDEETRDFVRNDIAQMMADPSYMASLVPDEEDSEDED